MTDSELQQKRFIAAAIDFAVAFAIGMAFAIVAFGLNLILGRSGSVVGLYASKAVTVLSAFVGVAYILLRDIVAGGVSVGKKAMGLRAMLTSGEQITLMDSVKRNGILCVGHAAWLFATVLSLIPCLGALANCMLIPLYVIAGLGSLVLFALEIYKIIEDPNGVRIGDQVANTRVVRAA